MLPSSRDESQFDWTTGHSYGGSRACIRYGMVWEDAEVLCAALAPSQPGARLLSVASAGDNALALLTLDPSEVVAIDVNCAQLACLELRIAAIAELEEDDLLAFLGITPSKTRLERYSALRPLLSPWSRRFFDHHRDCIQRGIIHSGRFERYLRAFTKYILPVIHPIAIIRGVQAPRDKREREQFYDSKWNNRRWRLACRVLFSRYLLSQYAREKSCFTPVRSPVGNSLLERARLALTNQPVQSNPYVSYILTGSYPPQGLPLYLRRDNRNIIRRRLARLRLLHGPVQAALDQEGYDGYNLSDIFEYMTTDQHEECYRALINAARPSARLVYWNLFVLRACPPSLQPRVRPLLEEAARLVSCSATPSYSAFHIDEVIE